MYVRTHGTAQMHRRATSVSARGTDTKTSTLPLLRPTGGAKPTETRKDAYDEDGLSPLNNVSRLHMRREKVRSIGEYVNYILAPQLRWAANNSGKSKDNPGETRDGNEKIVVTRESYDRIKYREMDTSTKLCRVIWFLPSGFGSLPKVWAVLSQSSYTVAITVVTTYLVKSETEAENLVNGRERWVDATKFMYNVFQMGVIVMGVLLAVNTINYLSYAWKSRQRILNETRFADLMAMYTAEDSTMQDYTLEYNPACDPDHAMAYFILREEEGNRKNRSAFTSFSDRLMLKVHDDLILDRLVRTNKNLFEFKSDVQ